MRHSTVVFVLCLALSGSALAQYGNEWIQYNQPYYKIGVAADGLYRLTYGDLQSAGFPVASVDPRRIQLFHRGVEQAIYIQGESDAHFDASDYIEFYGRKNDGTLDKELYKPQSSQPHNYYNIYNDTTAYFLTINAAAVLGKRMDFFSQVNSGGLPSETSHNASQLLIAHDNYSAGTSYSTYIFTAYDDVGEGWTGTQIGQGGHIDYTIDNLVNPVKSAGTPDLEVMLVGRYAIPHMAQIYVGPNASSLRPLSAMSFANYSTSTLDATLQWSDIGNDGRMIIRVEATGTGTGADYLSLDYARVTFPQALDANSEPAKEFNLNPNPGGTSYIEIANPPTGARLYDITNPDIPRIIGTTGTTMVKAIVDQTDVPRQLYLTASTFSAGSIRKISFRQFGSLAPDYVIISHPSLMKPASGYNDVVRAYAGYRHSAAGGGYDTLVADINQLYNQFSYGEETPVAILHFMAFLLQTHLPKYLFIVGKGLEPEYNFYRNPGAFTTYPCLVPSIGYPSSDNYFTTGLAGTTYEPAVPTGRISVTTPDEVADYLNKVKETESLSFQEPWRKNILHLSGGINVGEPERFAGYLQSFAQIAEGYYFGGSVTAISKENPSIDFVNINDEVNKGLDLVTFFGHSSPSTIDFDIGFVTDPQLGYSNKGKYPVFLMNGCNIGSFFLNTKVFGEDWVEAKDKGAIAFVAHSSYGLEGLLKSYSELFYQVGYGNKDFIGKGLGDIQKEVAKQFIVVNLPSVLNIAQVEEMVLLGDPAIKLFGATKPDYAVAEDGLSVASFSDDPITALSDSMNLRITVHNYGIAGPDSLTIQVKRKLENGTSTTYMRNFPPVLNSDTLSFPIYKEDGADAFGTNTFEVTLDPFDSLDELSESNNTASLDYFVPLSRTKTLFPAPYAVVSSTKPILTFQSTDLLSAGRDYVVEIDTTRAFDSPFKQEFVVNARVLGSMPVDLLTKDSTAYYWRTRYAATAPGESDDWSTASFTYIKNGQDGWAQVSFPQYYNNKVAGLTADSVQRKFDFRQTVTTVQVKTFGVDNPATNTDVSVRLNGTEYNLSIQTTPCRENTINLIAFDKTTTTPYIKGLDLNFDDVRWCGRAPKVIVSFQPSEFESADNKDLLTYIDNVDAGDSVLLFSIGDAGYSTWSSTAITKLGEIGISSSQIAGLTDGAPVVIFAKKGIAPGSAVIRQASGSPVTEQELLVDGTITGKYESGSMTSVRIGPASAWHKLYEKVKISETPVTDKFAFNVYGIGLDGKSTLVRQDQVDTVSLSSIFPDDYPYLDVVYNLSDSINLTPPQIRKWLVTYDPVAEGILVFNGDTSTQELQEGEPWSTQFGFTNISDRTFKDSLKVAVIVHNDDTGINAYDTMLVEAPAPGDTTWFEVPVETRSKAGINDLTVNVNPHILPEQDYDNNQLTLNSYLDIQRDTSNPVLDVTVDGRHLQDGDFVSPNPHVVLKVQDDNPYVLKTDTTGVTLFLQYPCDSTDCRFVPIYFGRSDVRWSPATSSDPFEMDFTPSDLPEGTYVLRAQGEDGSGNSSGTNPYEVSFQVDYSTSLVVVPPHPNPSSGVIYFGFTISGAVVPDYVDIEIITPTGTLVNKFSADRLHIGLNELVWDGTDINGARLAAGLYLYRIRVMSGGKALPLNTPDGIRAIRNGMGKVLLE